MKLAVLTGIGAISLISSLPVMAADLKLRDVEQYAKQDQIVSVSQFSDIRSTDWAYQSLNRLVEDYGCIAGYPDSTFRGGQAMTRYEAAALLNACLDRVAEVTDELRKLMDEFAAELATLRGRVDGLESRVGQLEATQFSTTTKLRGEATWVLGGLSYSGENKDNYNLDEAVTFNYDVKLNLDTSFTGKDLLRTQLRAGNFDNSGFGAYPGYLTQLSAGFQENATNGEDTVAINRMFYKFPIGENFTAVLGPKVRQDDALPVWPSAYTADRVLQIFQYAGAPGTYNLNLGSGAGLWYHKGGFSLGGAYVAANGDQGNSADGGLFNGNSSASTTVQLAYTGSNWNITGAYNYSTYNTPVAGTNFLSSSLPNSLTGGQSNSFSLAGYWQPVKSGWVPSISAGWGYSTIGYQTGGNATAQSWYTGLVWNDAFMQGNALGIAVGQPTFVTSLSDGEVNDGQYAFEAYYKVQVTDNISVTPSVFYLSAPMGQIDKNLSTFGALVQTTFRF